MPPRIVRLASCATGARAPQRRRAAAVQRRAAPAQHVGRRSRRRPARGRSSGVQRGRQRRRARRSGRGRRPPAARPRRQPGLHRPAACGRASVDRAERAVASRPSRSARSRCGAAQLRRRRGCTSARCDSARSTPSAAPAERAGQVARVVPVARQVVHRAQLDRVVAGRARRSRARRPGSRISPGGPAWRPPSAERGQRVGLRVGSPSCRALGQRRAALVRRLRLARGRHVAPRALVASAHTRAARRARRAARASASRALARSASSTLVRARAGARASWLRTPAAGSGSPDAHRLGERVAGRARPPGRAARRSRGRARGGELDVDDRRGRVGRSSGAPRPTAAAPARVRAAPRPARAPRRASSAARERRAQRPRQVVARRSAVRGQLGGAPGVGSARSSARYARAAGRARRAAGPRTPPPAAARAGTRSGRRRPAPARGARRPPAARRRASVPGSPPRRPRPGAAAASLDPAAADTDATRAIRWPGGPAAPAGRAARRRARSAARPSLGARPRAAPRRSRRCPRTGRRCRGRSVRGHAAAAERGEELAAARGGERRQISIRSTAGSRTSSASSGRSGWRRCRSSVR